MAGVSGHRGGRAQAGRLADPGFAEEQQRVAVITSRGHGVGQRGQRAVPAHEVVGAHRLSCHAPTLSSDRTADCLVANRQW